MGKGCLAIPQEVGGLHEMVVYGRTPCRIAERDGLDGLIWFIWFVVFIWFVSFNQTNQINQINKRNKPGLAFHAAQSVAAGGLFQRPAKDLRGQIIPKGAGGSGIRIGQETAGGIREAYRDCVLSARIRIRCDRLVSPVWLRQTNQMNKPHHNNGMNRKTRQPRTRRIL